MSRPTAQMQSSPIEDFLVTDLLPHQAFHQQFRCQQWLDYNTIHEFIFINSFIQSYPLLHFNQT